ncbi:unnamed protein product, partial [Didymodactylos carnosus]
MHVVIDAKLESYLLSFQRLVGRHTAVNILNEFDKVIKHYNIEKKIVRIVTNNASNNLAAFNRSDRSDDEIDIDIDDSGFNYAPDDALTNKNDNDIIYNNGDGNNVLDDISDTDFTPYIADTVDNNEQIRIPCYAHTIQLVLRDGIKECCVALRLTLGKIAKSAKLCRSSTIFADEFEKIHKTIRTSNETRWNSQFNMVKSFINILTATINSILIEKKTDELILSTKERQIVDEFISLFELFNEATIKTQSENKPPISIVAPSVLEILADLEKEKCKYLETLRASLLNSLKSRFGGLLSYFNIELPAQQRSMSKSFADPIFFISPVLDARFTFRWLDNVGLSPETIKCVTEKIKKMILNYTSQILGERIVTEARTQESAETVSNDSSCKKRKSLFSYLINAPKKVTTTNTAILAQLEEFLAEEGIDSNLIFQKQNKYPILLKLAKLFLS